MFFYRFIIIVFAIIFVNIGFSQSTYITDSINIRINLEKIERNDSLMSLAKKDLLADAERILENRRIYSIAYKEELPPSGDKNDYYSLSPYFWPDPNSKNGLPYIYRDGQVNPESRAIRDKLSFSNLSVDVYILGLAYYFTNDEKYVEWMKVLLDCFFINRDTRMNPNLDYGHMVKGKKTFHSATIGSLHLLKLIDGIQLGRNSNTWTEEFQTEIENWFSKYLHWMINSDKGREDNSAPNNIGTYYTAQIAGYALFTNQNELAYQILQEQGKSRIDTQINAEGEMNAELNRTMPWEYVKYNLTAFDYLVKLGRNVDIDLLTYTGKEGGSVLKVFRWLEKYAEGEVKWEYGKDVSPNTVKKVLLRFDSVKYDCTNCLKYENFGYLEVLTGDIF